MGDAFGYGQEIPNDSGSDYNAILFVCQQLVAKLETTKLVKVAAVHGGGEGNVAGTVDVQPLVSQIDGNGYGTPHGTVPGLPWVRIQSGTSGIICDPQVGDIGYVAACDRDISKVKNTLAPALPGSRRKFNISDGLYVGGVLNQAPTCYLLFTSDGYLKFVDAGGNVLQTSANGIALTPATGKPVTLNGSLVVTQNLQLGGAIQAQNGTEYGGNISTTGNVIAADVMTGTGGTLISLRGHQHPGNNTPPTPGH